MIYEWLDLDRHLDRYHRVLNPADFYRESHRTIYEAALEQLGGWDAHNVTEDADLGVRLCRAGYRTEAIDTVTYEEAACRTWPWIKQRSRWLKGYIQTYLVHMRRPFRLLRDLGPANFLHFQILIGGIVSAAQTFLARRNKETQGGDK